MSEEIVTVDLTGSFYQVDQENAVLSDTVIEINDSFHNIHSPRKEIKKRVSVSKNATKRPQKRPEQTESSKKARKFSSFECPICLDDMHSVPLASTSCGHVFCMGCLKKSLKEQKSCPKCRRALTGKFAYHPIYLF